MEINTNRIVDLKYNGKTDWRNLLQYRLNHASEDNFLSDNRLCDPVKQDVYLLMDSTTPRYKTANKYDTGLANLMNTLTDVVDNSTKNIPIIGRALSKLGIKVTDVVETALDVGTAITQPKINGVSQAWNPWFINAPTWEGVASTLSFQYTFKFTMGQFGKWDAKEEVFKPSLNLMSTTMVQNIGNFTMTGPYSRTIDALGGLAEDAINSLYKALALSDSSDVDTGMWDNLLKGTYTIKFGSILTLNNVLLKNSDVVFSSEVDEYGYPVSASVTLDFSTVIPQSLQANPNLLSMRFGKII